MKRRLTSKQQRFIQAYVENGGNATQAAIEAYCAGDYDTAKAIGCENLTKPYIRAEIERLMGDAQLTTRDAIRTIKEALDATTEKGPDWPTRLKAADMTLRLADAYPRERSEQEHLHRHLHVELERKLLEQPFEVNRFIVENNRWPTEEEKRQLLLGEGNED